MTREELERQRVAWELRKQRMRAEVERLVRIGDLELELAVARLRIEELEKSNA